MFYIIFNDKVGNVTFFALTAHEIHHLFSQIFHSETDLDFKDLWSDQKYLNKDFQFLKSTSGFTSKNIESVDEMLL